MPAIDAIEKAHCVAGVITNSTLLYCIRRHTRASLGAYKQLLTIFASYDLYLTILHVVIDPKILILQSVFGVISKSYFDDRVCFFNMIPPSLHLTHTLFVNSTESSQFLLLLLLCSLHPDEHPLPLSLMDGAATASDSALLEDTIHHVPLAAAPCGIRHLVRVRNLIPPSRHFPYYNISSGDRCLPCIYALTGEEYDGAVEILRAAFEKQHGINVTGGWIVMDWRAGSENPSPLPQLIMFDSVMVISLVLATTMGSLTYSGIRKQIKMSRSKQHMQLRLLISVSAQTFIPFICVYLPYFCCLTFTPLGIPAATVARVCFFLTACFPAWDAVIVILLMTEYRRAIGRMMPRLRPPTVSAFSQMTMMTRY